MLLLGGTQLAINRLAADKHIGNGGVALTTGLGVKGAWFEVLPSITIFGNYLLLVAHDNNAATDYEIDIGIGPSGSEEVLIPNITYHVSVAGNNIISVPYPIKVELPVGTRISARAINVAVQTVEVDINIDGT